MGAKLPSVYNPSIFLNSSNSSVTKNSNCRPSQFLRKAHQAELAQLKLDHAIDAALAAAGAKNAKAVKALLDVSKVKLGEDGKLTGWEEQIKAVQKSDSYLFAAKQQNHFRGFQPGASGDPKPGGKS